MPILIQCPSCGATSGAPDGAAGLPTKCGRCGAVVSGPPTKVCSSCGTDLSQTKRVKDPRGTGYYCPPCYDARLQSARRHAVAATRFVISGADSDTGEDVEFVVDAGDKDEAYEKAL